MKPPGAERRLAAVLAAQLAGGQREHRGRLARLIAARGGRIAAAPGDPVHAEFASAAEALECAAGIQRELALSNAALPQSQRLELRIGIHPGEVLADPLGIYGDAVDLAARLEGVCEPGGVALSASAFEQVRGKPGLRFIDRGEHALEGVARPVRVYALDVSGNAIAAPAPLARRRAAAAAIVLVALAAWLAGAPELAKRLRAPVQRPPAAVAVLPFADASGDPARLQFRDGFTQDIAGALGRLSAVRLHQEDGPDVRYLVRGSVEHADGEELIRVELREAASGTLLWSEEYAGEAAELLDIQDHIVMGLAGALGIEPTEAERRALRRSPAAVSR